MNEKSTNEKPINGMTGGLFTGEPLRFVGGEREDPHVQGEFYDLCMAFAQNEIIEYPSWAVDSIRERYQTDITESELRRDVKAAVEFARAFVSGKGFESRGKYFKSVLRIRGLSWAKRVSAKPPEPNNIARMRTIKEIQ